MSKRFLGVILSLSCALSLAACSGGESSSSAESESASSGSSSVPAAPASVSVVETEKPGGSQVDNTQKVKDAVKINDYVGAYLYIPDTKIDTPVLDSAKNYEKPAETIAMYINRFEETKENGEVVSKRLSNLNWAREEVGLYGAPSPYIYGKSDYSSREKISPNIAVLGYNIGVLDASVFDKAWDKINAILETEDYKALSDAEKRNLLLDEYVKVDDYPEGVEFAQLFHFLDEDFVKSHPYIFLSTEKENFVYEVFAVSYLEAEPEFRYYSSRLSQEDAYGAAKQAVDHSIWLYPEVEVAPEDKIISLSTVSYSYFDNAYDNEKIRFVITGRLLPADAELKETCKVEKNPSPVAPKLPEKK